MPQLFPGTHSFLTISVSEIVAGTWETKHTTAAYCVDCHQIFPPGLYNIFPCGTPSDKGPRAPTLTLVE